MNARDAGPRRPAAPETTPLQVAAIRAFALLAEMHQPLTMTPGDVRALLGRYQRRLQDLAEAVLPGTHAASADAAALASLRAHWQARYYIAVDGGIWSASPLADRSVLLTADTAAALRTAVENDHAARAARARQPASGSLGFAR